MFDNLVQKPPSVRGYALHRLTEGLTNGGRPLYADCGDHFLVRTKTPVTDSGKQLRQFKTGDVLAFELRACVSKKIKGKHKYFTRSDWRSRHEWLHRKAEKHGFEVRALHCTSEIAKIDDGSGRRFTVDRTDFTGVLGVADVEKFNDALANGVGNTGRAFGFGMLII